jgi:hypothetical protein
MESTAQPEAGANAGRRSSPRARLNIPAQLVLLDGKCYCMVDNLSREGARIVPENELSVGDEGILQRDGLDQFFVVSWVDDGRCGLRFEEAVDDELVLALRRIADDYDNLREQQLREIGREWVEGRIGRING